MILVLLFTPASLLYAGKMESWKYRRRIRLWIEPEPPTLPGTPQPATETELPKKPWIKDSMELPEC